MVSPPRCAGGGSGGQQPILSVVADSVLGVSRYRLLPTPDQEAGLLAHCGHARFVWNLAVEQHQHWRPGFVSAPGYVEQARQLTAARAEHSWLAAGSVTVQQQALRDFHQSMASFFRGTHRRPTWRKAGVHEGFRQVGVRHGQVKRINRRFGGVAVSAALSTGELLVCPGLRSAEVMWLRRLQRRLARAKRGSNRRKKIKTAIAGLRARETDRRKDWVEKTSTDLARRCDVIRVEDLRIRNMTRSSKGCRDQPGRHVRRKARLNRGILANGWGRLVTRLEHKASGRVEKISSVFTSQTCHACGHRASENRESQAVFRCVACGHRAHADVNAAKNIAAGRAVTARGALQPLGGAVNREPHPATSTA